MHHCGSMLAKVGMNIRGLKNKLTSNSPTAVLALVTCCTFCG